MQKKIHSTLLLLILLLLANYSFAQDYYWRVTLSHYTLPSVQVGTQFSSGQAFLNAAQSDFNANGITAANGLNCRFTSETAATCSYGSTGATAVRYGDSCPASFEYNPTTGGCQCPPGTSVDPSGQCVPPPPECPVGDELLAKSPGPILFSDGLPYVAATAPTVCSVGCSYDPSGSGHSGCYADPGSTTTGFCNYLVTGTGEPCSVENLIPGGEGDPLPSPNCPAGYSWSGTTCVADTPPDGGDGTGGTGDGTGGTGGGTGGTGDGTGGTGGGTGGTGDGEGEGDGLPSGTLQQPERASFADALTEWDQKIADARVELKAKHGQLAQLVSSQTVADLSDTSGRLYCESVPVAGTTFDICLDDYEDELSGIKWILIFMATVLAFYIIFVRD